jgi:hypothetical protein
MPAPLAVREWGQDEDLHAFVSPRKTPASLDARGLIQNVSLGAHSPLLMTRSPWRSSKSTERFNLEEIYRVTNVNEQLCVKMNVLGVGSSSVMQGVIEEMIE